MGNLLENTTLNWVNLREKEVESDDTIVTNLIGMLSNYPAKPKELNYSEELEIIAKLLESISEAIKDDTITESQANVLLRYLVSGMLSQRVTNIFDHLFSKKTRSSWFLAAGRQYQSEDW